MAEPLAIYRVFNMTINPANLNLTIYQGYTFNDVWYWENEDGTPVDLTTYTATIQARYNLTDSSPFLTLSTLNGGITLGGTAGSILVNMSSAATATLTPGEGVWNLQMVGGGISGALLQGIIIIQEMPTR